MRSWGWLFQGSVCHNLRTLFCSSMSLLEVFASLPVSFPGWGVGLAPWNPACHLSHTGLCGLPASWTDLPPCFGQSCWAGPSEYHCLPVASVFPGLNSIHSCLASLRRSSLYLQVSSCSLIRPASPDSFPGSLVLPPSPTRDIQILP